MSLTELDPSKTLDTLSTTLDTLEATLEPLLSSSTSLTDLFARLEAQGDTVSPIERAHARIMLAYTVHDLIWVYLRICAIDQATHPVMAELTRLKTYFSKLHRAEPTLLQTNSTQAEAEAGPSTISITENGRRTNLDIDAATRFINAAISGKRKASTDAKGKHTRFDGEEEVEDGSSSSGSSEEEVNKALSKKDVKTDGKKQIKKVPMGRPKMDPFMGFDDQTTSSINARKQSKSKGNSVETSSAATSSEGKKKKRVLSVSDAEPTPTSTSATTLLKHQKKLRLKAGGGLPGEGLGSSSKEGEGKKKGPKKVKKATNE
ncbi:BQ2448_3352 [Microbotryum intermedium]|uniref:Exosome complex protein n=1 Tax=Microbotryum intermedium TaxID=269621 RepID=A0A238F9S5_9BASI|nr:BQ2448_3352 [Microbotryum intermedium]